MPSLGAGTPMRAQRRVIANSDTESIQSQLSPGAEAGRGWTRQGEEGEVGRGGRRRERMVDVEKEKHKEKGGTESSVRRRVGETSECDMYVLFFPSSCSDSFGLVSSHSYRVYALVFFGLLLRCLILIMVLIWLFSRF